MSKKDIIIINGKHYDTKTGDLLGSAASHHQQQTAVKPRASSSSVAAKKPAARKPAQHTAAHSPKPAHTLMRRAVKKPLPSHRQAVKAQGHLTSQPFGDVQVKPSVRRLDMQRLEHAKHINKSQLVSRFSSDLFGGSLSTPASQTATHPAAPKPRPSSHDRKPKTTAELLDYAIHQATAHQEEPAKPVRRGLFKRRARSALA